MGRSNNRHCRARNRSHRRTRIRTPSGATIPVQRKRKNQTVAPFESFKFIEDREVIGSGENTVVF